MESNEMLDDYHAYLFHSFTARVKQDVVSVSMKLIYVFMSIYGKKYVFIRLWNNLKHSRAQQRRMWYIN